MESQNEQLEKILKLIQENFEAKTISNNDLNEIIFYSAGLVKVENLGLVQANKAFNYQWKFDDIGVIPHLDAEAAKKLFVTKFGKNPTLANKVFRFESTLISDILKQGKNLDVYFSQDSSGNLCLVLNNGNAFYEITANSSKIIAAKVKIERSDLYKETLKKTIETNLSKDYTEYLTIPYFSNFDQFNGIFPKTIVLVPAISTTGRMTLIMNFEGYDGITAKGVDSDYDTFTPHP